MLFKDKTLEIKIEKKLKIGNYKLKEAPSPNFDPFKFESLKKVTFFFLHHFNHKIYRLEFFFCAYFIVLNNLSHGFAKNKFNLLLIVIYFNLIRNLIYQQFLFHYKHTLVIIITN